MRYGGPIQRYPLVRVAVMLTIGIAFGDALHGAVAPWMWMCAFALVVGVFLPFYFMKRHPIFQTIMVFLAIAIAGAWRMDSCMADQEIDYRPTEEMYRAVVASVPASNAAGKNSARYELVVADGRIAGHCIYAYIPDAKLYIGDGLVITSRFQPAYIERQQKKEDAGSRHFNYRRWLMSHGIVARTYVGGGKWHRALVALNKLSGVQRARIRFCRYRNLLLEKYRNSGLSDNAYAIVAAMTFGDKTTLTKDLRETFSISGASHILALSGMHLGLIYSLLSLIFIRYPRDIYMHAFILTVVWGYVLMVGMSASVVRSAIMLTLFTLLTILMCTKVSLNTLGISALLQLGFSPLSLWDISLEMSFLAVLGILLVNIVLEGLLPMRYLMKHRWIRWSLTMVIVSISAQILVAPLVLYYFGRFSLYFLLSNFIAIPMAMCIIYSSLFVWCASLWPWLQMQVISALEWETKALTDALGWVASLPGANIDNVCVNGWQLALMYVFIALLYILSFYAKKMYYSAYGYRLEKYERRNDI